MIISRDKMIYSRDHGSEGEEDETEEEELDVPGLRQIADEADCK